MGQLYVWIKVDVRAALERGAVSAGITPVLVTPELLAALDAPQVALIERYTTVGCNEPPTGYCASDVLLRASGTEQDDIIAALTAELQRREAKVAEAARWEMERKAQRAAKHTERIERLRTADVDRLVTHSYGPPIGKRWTVKDTAIVAEAGRLDEAHAECAARNAQDVDMAEAERIAAELEAAERAEWIAAHGSERLRRLAREGIEHGAVYRDERLALERPGWVWERDVPGEGSEPRNVPVSALQLLDDARVTDPESELVYWTVELDDYDDEDKDNTWRGYVARATFLDRAILFGDELPRD